MKKKDILIIAHFCDYGTENSNNRFNYIAQLLYNEGVDVELVTSSFSHRDKRQRNENCNAQDYKMTLLYEPSYTKNVSLKRFLYSHRIMAINLRKYLKERKKPDLIYCAVPSLDVAYEAKRYAGKYQIPFIVDIQDLWPEAFQMVLNIPIISDVLFAPLYRKADKIYSMADKIVGVSETYVNRGVCYSRCSSGLCIYLGIDLAYFDRFSKSCAVEKSEEEIWVVYAGTLGHSYDIPLVIDAFLELKKQGYHNVKCKILGDGPLYSEFKDYAYKKKADVEFMGKMPYSEMIAYLCKSDIAINPIAKGSAASIINKHGDYAAAGLPVINTQESVEYRDLIERYQCGINCGVESVKEVAEAMELLVKDKEMAKKMGLNSRKLAEEKFDRKCTYQQLIKLIVDIKS